MNLEQVMKERVQLLINCKDNPQLQQIEVELCKRDILYRFRNYADTDKNSSLFTSDEPDIVPLYPFEFQEEMITEKRKSALEGRKPINERQDLTNVFEEKSRQMGASWINIAIIVYAYIFHNMKCHCVSQKEKDVDEIGNIRSLLGKARFILNRLPDWMLPPGYDRNTATPYNKTLYIGRSDGTGAITGESAHPDACRSGTYDIIWMDEMAFMSNATTINSAAASASPCRWFTSTPNGQGNEYYRMRSKTTDRVVEGQLVKASVKGLRYLRSDHPVYSQPGWYEWRTANMTREQIAQEILIDYNTAIVGRVYADFPKNATQVMYNPEKPLYISIDNSHGGTDPNAIILCQQDTHNWNIIDAVEINATPEDCARFLSCQPTTTLTYSQSKFLERYEKYNWRKAVFIADPYDTLVAMGNSVILDDYKKVGINLMIPRDSNMKVPPKTEQILMTRTNIYRIKYNDYCEDFASAIMNAKYPERKEGSNSTTESTKPVHDWTSHYRTALEYLATYLVLNPVAVRVESPQLSDRPMNANPVRRR